MALAVTSLPVPVSPSRSIGASQRAIFRISDFNLIRAGQDPIRLSFILKIARFDGRLNIIFVQRYFRGLIKYKPIISLIFQADILRLSCN